MLTILSLLICTCGAMGDVFAPPSEYLQPPKTPNAVSASSMLYHSFPPPAPFVALARPNFVLPTPFYLAPRRRPLPPNRVYGAPILKKPFHHIPLESAPPATPFPDFEIIEHLPSHLTPPEVVSELPVVPPPPPPPPPPPLLPSTTLPPLRPEVYQPPVPVYGAPFIGDDIFSNAPSAKEGKISFSLVSVLSGFDKFVSSTTQRQVVVSPALEYGL